MDRPLSSGNTRTVSILFHYVYSQQLSHHLKQIFVENINGMNLMASWQQRFSEVSDGQGKLSSTTNPWYLTQCIVFENESMNDWTATLSLNIGSLYLVRLVHQDRRQYDYSSHVLHVKIIQMRQLFLGYNDLFLLFWLSWERKEDEI